MPKEIENLSQKPYATIIWKLFMDNIHEGLPVIEIDPYAQQESETMPSDTTQNSNEITPTPTEQPSDIISNDNEEDTTNANTNPDNSAEQYRVTPPPDISWGEQYDPTHDPN